MFQTLRGRFAANLRTRGQAPVQEVTWHWLHTRAQAALHWRRLCLFWVNGYLEILRQVVYPCDKLRVNW